MSEGVFQGSLFSSDFLTWSISRLPDWSQLDDAALEALRLDLRRIFDRFPTAQSPNESQTEDDLIWRIKAGRGGGLARDKIASWGSRLFVRRVELVGEIDKGGGENEQLQTVRSDTAARLHEEVAAMGLDNFIVRPKRLFVEHYAEKAAWENLSDADKADLINEVAGLPSGLADDDFDAKQFDLLLLRAQLALLRSDHAFEGLRNKIVAIAGLLEELQNDPDYRSYSAFTSFGRSQLHAHDISNPHNLNSAEGLSPSDQFAGEPRTSSGP